MGCSIFGALLPEVSLSDVLQTPTASSMLESIEGLGKLLASLFDVLKEEIKEGKFPVEVIDKMIEAVEGSEPEVTVESESDSVLSSKPEVTVESESDSSLRLIDAQRSKETFALLLSCIAVSMMLTFSAVRMSDCLLP